MHCEITKRQKKGTRKVYRVRESGGKKHRVLATIPEENWFSVRREALYALRNLKYLLFTTMFGGTEQLVRVMKRPDCGYNFASTL